MVTTFCTSGQVLVKAGKGLSGTISGAQLHYGIYPVDEWINQAESEINVYCRENFITNYATLSSDKKKILESVASDMAAIRCVMYDMSGYTSRVEAEDIITVLRDSILRGLSILRDKKAQDFINAA